MTSDPNPRNRYSVGDQVMLIGTGAVTVVSCERGLCSVRVVADGTREWVRTTQLKPLS